MNPQEPKNNPHQTEAHPPTAEELLQRYSRAVLAVCLARLNNRHDAEDVMQDVFVKAIGKLHRLKDSTRVGPWLLAIARTTCIDHLRKRRPIEPLPENVPAPTPTSDSSMDHLHTMIHKLPPDYAEVISLYYLDGHRSSNVAALLGITSEAVRQRLVRARALLHNILREETK